VDHYDETARIRLPEKDEPVFFFRTVGIRDGDRERIAERGRGLLEGDVVFGQVEFGLFGIPFEVYVGVDTANRWDRSIERVLQAGPRS